MLLGGFQLDILVNGNPLPEFSRPTGYLDVPVSTTQKSWNILHNYLDIYFNRQLLVLLTFSKNRQNSGI